MENKEPEVIIENEQDNLLDKFETPSASSPAKKKKSSSAKLLIIALAAALALGGVLCFLLFAPQSSEVTDKASDGTSVKTGLNSNKEWQANVKLDKNGKVKQNGGGSLLEKVPAEISRIELQNSGGNITIKSYTPKTKTKETDPETGETVEKTSETEYTIVGFEKLDLQSGVPDEIANACSTLEFSSISDPDASSHLADYGFDKPRAVAKVFFNDDSTAVIKVGNDAPQRLGTYVMFGSGNEVFLCDTEKTKTLLFTINDLVSLTVNKSADDAASSDFKTLTINDVTLKPNKDIDYVQNQYVLDDGSFADDTEASQVSGAVRGLYAESVAAVNPSADQLKKLGLSSPKARIKAEYSDTIVSLIASKPDSKGKCHLMETDGNIVYTIASASIPWVSTSRDKLTSDYLLNVKLSGLSKMTVTASGKTYNFDVKTTVTKTTDDDGEETDTTDTKIKFNGKELDSGYFQTFFDNCSMLKYEKGAVKNSGSSNPLTIKYTYSKSRKPDTIVFTKSGSSYIAIINGKATGFVYRSYVENLVKQAATVSKDKEVKSFW